MRSNELKDLMFKLCDFGDERYEIVKAEKTAGVWFLTVEVDEPTDMDVYEIVRALNGWDKSDYWSVRKIENCGGGNYTLVTKRVLVNNETSAEAE